ncbi:MAG: FxsA family protein [Deltaproteobacteria bacterium]|nr:FxsA family protein [Deltaproteobacteria bacterium]
MRLSIFILIFLVLEVTSIIKVGSALGASGAIGLLVLDLIIGGILFNFQSQRLRTTMQRPLGNQAAGTGPLNALSLYLAAFLFVFPGFVSDVFALLLLFPPTRVLLLAGVGQFLLKRLGPRMQRMQSFRVYDFSVGHPYGGFPDADSANKRASPAENQGDDIIEGEFRDVTDLRDRDPGCAVLPEETDGSKREG